jgi:hypothetical protein
VRKQRLYREARFEIAPAVSFTLLDEYQRTILFGARLTYNFTDWLGIGVWGAYGAIKIPTSLTDHIQEVNETRRGSTDPPYDQTLTSKLTASNLSASLEDQIAGIDWIVSPQLTLVPFRGKLAVFESIYADTDLYFSLGPAFIGLKERGDCAEGECSVAVNPDAFETASRMAIAPSGAAGITFYLSKWSGIGFEYRMTPFAWNTGGFDIAGKDPDGEFPDNAITDADREFKFNQLMTISFNVYLPSEHRISE